MICVTPSPVINGLQNFKILKGGLIFCLNQANRAVGPFAGSVPSHVGSIASPCKALVSVVSDDGQNPFTYPKNTRLYAIMVGRISFPSLELCLKVTLLL